MSKHRTRVGLHARNDIFFPSADYRLIRTARIETLKMMSFTDISVYQRLLRENPGLEFIVRLYDDRLRHDSRPAPADFVAKMVPIINRLKPYVTKFEIHNEPNHAEGIEAWGPTDQHARSFRSWYQQVLPALKEACPWAKFGFPGLAPNSPHRDLEWLDICRDVILASDWLGCHCYWQYGNMMKDDWGLRFKLYHERFPDMRIEITEFGDSTPDRPREQIAKQYVRYYQELNRYPYLGSASAFIASSPDPKWVLFVWMKEGGEMLPVVQAVGRMKRVAVEIRPVPKLPPRTFSETGKTVSGAFLEFFNQYGLDICGYPITDQFTEAGLPSQYFQRLALEEGKPGKVRLKLIGSEVWRSRRTIAQLRAYINELRSLPVTGLAQPDIQDITAELPTHPSKKYSTRQLTDINQIVIHHTGTSPTITPQRLARYQVERVDKPGIGYHFVITADGTIYQTNRLETVSDHAFSRNQDSVGVCFTGNFGKVIPTTAQIESGGKLCAWLLSSLRLSTRSIVGLGEFVNTQSPGRQWLKGERWKDKLLAQVEAAIQVGGQDYSVLISSLREQIATLKAEIARLEQRPPSQAPVPTTSLQDIVSKLGTLITSLQSQILALQRENDRLTAHLGGAGGSTPDQAALIASLKSQIEALEQERDNALADLTAVETALQAKDAGQAALVTSLREQIKALQKDIARLRAQPPAQPVVTEPHPAPADKGVARPPIQDLRDKLSKHSTEKYGTRPLSDIKTLVIHHSAVPASVTPQRIAAYHVKSLGWPGVGYHFMVAEDGVIYQGNSLQTVSNHAAKVNPRGVGICFLGNFNSVAPPPAQLRAGALLVAWLLQELKLDLDVVKGHKEFMQTACPGNQWLRGKRWKQMLRQEVVKVQEGTVSGLLPTAADKPIYHYVLFWHHGDSWANRDWASAEHYVAAFQPTVGFSAEVAAQARYVTIIGGVLGVPKKVEDWLVAQGCKVERIAGADEAATKQLLNALVKEGKRFQSFNE